MKNINKSSFRKRRFAKDDPRGMSLIVKTVARLMVGIFLLYGANIAMQGQRAPGGGFAGGVIMALSFLALILAFGKDVAIEKLNRAWALVISAQGLLILIFVVLIKYSGPYTKGLKFASLLNSWFLGEEGIISLSNMAVCLQASAGIFVVFICLILIKGRDGSQ